jgi:hypothetical protein
MPKNRIRLCDAKHSKLPLPRLCITANRSPKFSKLIDVSADLPVADSAGLCELRDCCAAKEQGFCCAELLEFCGERELCVRHSEVSKKSPARIGPAETGAACLWLHRAGEGITQPATLTSAASVPSALNT